MQKIKPWQLLVALSSPIIAIFCYVLCRSMVMDAHHHHESLILTPIVRDAMKFRATPERIAERTETELGVSVGFSPEDVGEEAVIALPPHTIIFGQGGRWLLFMKLGKDGKCDQAWLEMQPVGWL